MSKRLCPMGLAVLVVVECLLATGCGGTPPPAVTAEEEHLATLARAYGLYMSQNRGKTPPSEEKFKSFLKSLPADQRAARGVKGDVDKLFVSPRDKQPYVVRYNLASAGVPNPSQPEVIAYEKTGVSDRRYVAYSTTQVEEVDNAKFKKLVPNG